MMLSKCCTQYASKCGKLSSGHRTGKGQFSFQSQKKAMPKNAQTTAQLAMPDGGAFAIVVPELPLRCPPAPYERACLVAAYFRRAKPRAKVLVLDANPEVASEAALFTRAWAELYPGMIEYRPDHRATAVDGARRTVSFEVQDDVSADVLNVLPPMRAADLAVRTGLANANRRWCMVDFLAFESTAARHVHVIGDAIQTAPAMPKSGHMANAQAKVCAAAIVAELTGRQIDPQPTLGSTCYSFVAPDQAIHLAGVHRYDSAQRTMLPVPGAGGVSSARSAADACDAQTWADNIWADMLA